MDSTAPERPTYLETMLDAWLRERLRGAPNYQALIVARVEADIAHPKLNLGTVTA